MAERKHMAAVGGGRSAYFNPARVLQIVALTFAVAAVLGALFLPGGFSVTQTSDGRQYIETPTLLQTMGQRLVIPLFLTAVPLLFPGRGWQGISIAATIALAGSSIIGWFFLPALAAAVAVLFLDEV
jgi:hypothetical protein